MMEIKRKTSKHSATNILSMPLQKPIQGLAPGPLPQSGASEQVSRMEDDFWSLVIRLGYQRLPMIYIKVLLKQAGFRT